MRCSRCQGRDAGCYVCREEPTQDDRDPHKEAVERELEEDNERDAGD